jgi:hypothetical protein
MDEKLLLEKFVKKGEGHGGRPRAGRGCVAGGIALLHLISSILGSFGFDLGCQMACFQTKSPTLGKFLEGLANGRCWYILWLFGLFYDHLVYFMNIWHISRPFGIFYNHLVYFPRFGNL